MTTPLIDFADDPRRGCAPGKVAPDAFFADRSDPVIELARKACRGCDFRSQCLDRALDQDEQHGVWGGVLMSSKPERDKAIALRNEFRVIKGWQRGLSDGDIALRTGLHPSSVQKIRSELGLAAHFGPGGRRAKREQAAA
jgi:hypothetical protein